jgi:hypothetical protein
MNTIKKTPAKQPNPQAAITALTALVDMPPAKPPTIANQVAQHLGLVIRAKDAGHSNDAIAKALHQGGYTKVNARHIAAALKKHEADTQQAVTPTLATDHPAVEQQVEGDLSDNE